MGLGRLQGPTEQRQAVLDDFLRGHISAGELSKRLQHGRTGPDAAAEPTTPHPGPPPGDGRPASTGRRRRAAGTGGPPRGWLITALVLIAAVGGVVGSAIGAQPVTRGLLHISAGRAAQHRIRRRSRTAAAGRKAPPLVQGARSTSAAPVPTVPRYHGSRPHSPGSHSQSTTRATVTTGQTTTATSTTSSASTLSTSSTTSPTTTGSSTTATSTTSSLTTSSGAQSQAG